MSDSGPLSERAVILLPLGRDAEVASLILQEAGFLSVVCRDLNDFCKEIRKGAGSAIVGDEAIISADLRAVSDILAQQEPWSDLPIVLMTHRGAGLERNPAAERQVEVLGNVTFLERPFHPTTLASVNRAAIRSRRRQYEARSRLQELRRERSALAELTAQLEQRVRDRTAELMAETAAREETQERLLQSQKLESLGKLTGGIAHDFNNLLMAVMGSLELLRKRLPQDAQGRRLVESALQGAKRGATLTQRMLAFARQQELKTNSTDLSELLINMKDLLDRTLGAQIKLAIDVEAGLPPIQVDADQVELAVLNLVINARDAMPAGGKINIEAARDISQSPELDSAQFLCLSVSDTGTGMDSDTLRKAVEPFFTTKPPGKGTGLGLSMIHGLAEQLGGRFDLASQIGQGTTATLWLPVASTPAISKVESSPARGLKRTGTVLVVDDDPLISMGTVDMLIDLGFRTIEANSARQALEILGHRHDIDLVITDQIMPDMTGTELAERVKTERPGLPILLATGYTDLPDGASSDLPRLSKPYLQRDLQNKLNELLL